MTAITVELSADAYRKLQAQAQRIGKVPELVAGEWLSAWLATTPMPLSARERAREALRAAGLLVEFSAEEQAHAQAAVTLTLEEVRAALDRAGGKPLSEIILDMRGPKE